MQNIQDDMNLNNKNNKDNRNGKLYVLSSPSGVGKTTIATKLLKMDKSIVRSISNTTREARVDEEDGIDYHFISIKEFQDLIEKNEMLEYATVFTDYYGTPKKDIDKFLNEGKDVLCCIDWQGALQIKESKQDSITIFLLPPSFDELKRRLKNRNTDSESVIEYRLNEAKLEITKATEYDYVMFNDDLEITIDSIYSLIKLNRKNIEKNNNRILLIEKLLAE